MLQGSHFPSGGHDLQDILEGVRFYTKSTLSFRWLQKNIDMHER